MKIFLSFILMLSSICSCAQINPIDSLKKVLQGQKEDTNKVNTLSFLGYNYEFHFPDTGVMFLQQGLQLAKKLKYEKGEAFCMINLLSSLAVLGDYANALNFGLKGLSLSQKIKDTGLIILAYGELSWCYRDQGDYKTGLENAHEAWRLTRLLHVDENGYNNSYDYHYYPYLWSLLSSLYEKNNQLDLALYFGNKAYHNYSYVAYTLGSVYTKLGNKELAIDFYKKATLIAIKYSNQKDIIDVYNGMAKLYKNDGNTDSAIYYSKQAMIQEWSKTYPLGILEASTMLTGIYESKKNKDSTLKYLKLTIALKDSLFSREKTRDAQSLAFNEQLHQQQLVDEKKQIQNKIKVYTLLGALFVFLLVAVLLWRNNSRKQKLNSLLQKQKEKIENTLTELKSAQSQLIQSEKMASLGELTAAIAHEIQNPLNFVNNFSEVSNELISEMVDEVDQGNTEEVKAIAQDVRQNLEKILYHGKRADAIVKGMLQHSRASTGKKEPTNINALADEYLRLSYHGMRAKDKNFNATLQTDFDATIQKINIVPQDIGRVLLNLFNNAFYSVTEKKKQQPEDYKPIVSVSTKKLSDKIEIRVKDNGVGIPQKIVDKIFQPFFTTKPTGQGTGLGLSLSYDIIKAHGGEIRVETKEGEGSEFIVHLPA